MSDILSAQHGGATVCGSFVSQAFFRFEKLSVPKVTLKRNPANRQPDWNVIKIPQSVVKITLGARGTVFCLRVQKKSGGKEGTRVCPGGVGKDRKSRVQDPSARSWNIK